MGREGVHMSGIAKGVVNLTSIAIAVGTYVAAWHQMGWLMAGLIVINEVLYVAKENM